MLTATRGVIGLEPSPTEGLALVFLMRDSLGRLGVEGNMGIFETFSKRQKKRQQAGKIDVFAYDVLPDAFRRQVIHIWGTAIGAFEEPRPYLRPSPANRMWWEIHSTLARELGVFTLGGQQFDSPFTRCQAFLLREDLEPALDIIELTFKVINGPIREMNDYEREEAGIRQSADSAIGELNHRFREHGLGYQFEGNELVRIDSQYVHAEIVRPAIQLLQRRGFSGPHEEFMRAHEHYRKGRDKEAVNEALKAFESTMKAICHLRKWSFPANATARPLLELLIGRGLIPAELSGHLSGLRAALEAGLPTLRNRISSHGQGAETTEVPPHVVALSIHLAAANIVFLVEAHLRLK